MIPTLDVTSPMCVLRHLSQHGPRTLEDLLYVSPTQPDTDEILTGVLRDLGTAGFVDRLPSRHRTEPRYFCTAAGAVAVVRHLRGPRAAKLPVGVPEAWPAAGKAVPGE